MQTCRIGQAAESLEDATLEMQRVAAVVEATSKTMSNCDPLRPHMDLIYVQASYSAAQSRHMDKNDDAETH